MNRLDVRVDHFSGIADNDGVRRHVLVTTEPAPITHESPTVTPGRINARPPMKQFRPMRVSRRTPRVMSCVRIRASKAMYVYSPMGSPRGTSDRTWLRATSRPSGECRGPTRVAGSHASLRRPASARPWHCSDLPPSQPFFDVQDQSRCHEMSARRHAGRAARQTGDRGTVLTNRAGDSRPRGRGTSRLAAIRPRARDCAATALLSAHRRRRTRIPRISARGLGAAANPDVRLA